MNSTDVVYLWVLVAIIACCIILGLVCCYCCCKPPSPECCLCLDTDCELCRDCRNACLKKCCYDRCCCRCCYRTVNVKYESVPRSVPPEQKRIDAVSPHPNFRASANGLKDSAAVIADHRSESHFLSKVLEGPNDG